MYLALKLMHQLLQKTYEVTVKLSCETACLVVSEQVGLRQGWWDGRVGGRPHKLRHTYRTGGARYWAMGSPGATPTSWMGQDPRGSPWMRAWARWARLRQRGLSAQGEALAGLGWGALLEFWRRRALYPVVLPLLHWYSPSLQLYVLYMWNKLHQISSLSIIGRTCNIKVHALSEDAITWLQQTPLQTGTWWGDWKYGQDMSCMSLM